jgi:hypothetical protein
MRSMIFCENVDSVEGLSLIKGGGMRRQWRIGDADVDVDVDGMDENVVKH